MLVLKQIFLVQTSIVSNLWNRSWQRLVRVEAGVTAQYGHQGLVTQLESVRLAAKAGVLQPCPLVVSRLKDE